MRANHYYLTRYPLPHAQNRSAERGSAVAERDASRQPYTLTSYSPLSLSLLP